LDEQQRQVLKIASESIEAFGKMFLPKAVSAATPDFHRDIYQDLQDNSIKRLAVIAPRGHSKSTVTSILYVLWRILFKPADEDLLIVMVSESQQQAINFLTIVKTNLTDNPRVNAFFGDMSGKKWTEDDITCANGSRVIARGTGQRIRGTVGGVLGVTRPNVLIFDDFESETNSNTRDQIIKNKDWLLKAALPSLADDGRAIAIGTIISQFAFLADVQKEGSGWKTHFYQAFKDGKIGGEPLWPERFPKERLMEIYKSYDSMGKRSAFWQEYMNKPIDIDSQTFQEADFRYYSGSIILVDDIQPCILGRDHPMQEEEGYPDDLVIPLSVSLGVDLAISEAYEADFTVIMPLAIDASGYRLILPFLRFKEPDIDVLVQKILDTAISTGCGRVNIEAIQFQQAVANHFQKKMMESGRYMVVSCTKPRTSKDSRIRSLQPLFKSHKIFHQEWMHELEDELINYPRAGHDDIPDALWLAEQEAILPDMDPFIDGENTEHREEEAESWLVL